MGGGRVRNILIMCRRGEGGQKEGRRGRVRNLIYSRLFGAQMTLASLVAISGLKKSQSQFSGPPPPPFQWPLYQMWPASKSFYPRHINNRYIGNFLYTSFAAGVICILCSLFCTVFLPSKGPPPPFPLRHRDKVNSLRPDRGGRGRGGGLSLPHSPPSPFVQDNLEINSNMKGAKIRLRYINSQFIPPAPKTTTLQSLLCSGILLLPYFLIPCNIMLLR